MTNRTPKQWYCTVAVRDHPAGLFPWLGGGGGGEVTLLQVGSVAWARGGQALEHGTSGSNALDWVFPGGSCFVP